MYGADTQLMSQILEASARRLCKTAKCDTPLQILKNMPRGLIYLRALFILFLNVDPTLRSELCEGVFSTEKGPISGAWYSKLDSYKADVLFTNMELKTDNQDILQLVENFTNEYIVS
jgi:hypothetical protein